MTDRYSREEISKITDFDKKDKFPNPDAVRYYFYMKGIFTPFYVEDCEVTEDRPPIPSSDVLDEMAEIVIKNQWHCDFDDGLLKPEEIPMTDKYDIDKVGGRPWVIGEQWYSHPNMPDVLTHHIKDADGYLVSSKMTKVHATHIVYCVNKEIKLEALQNQINDINEELIKQHEQFLDKFHERIIQMKRACEYKADNAGSQTESLKELSKASAYGEVTIELSRERRKLS